MIAGLLDDPDGWIFILMVVSGAAWLFLRWRHRKRVIDSRLVKSLGAFAGGELRLYLVSSPGGRHYVSLEYEVQEENTTREVEVLFSGKQAAALANHLEVAAFPHASLAYARAAARRARVGRTQA